MEDGTARAPAQKRRRVAVACDQCRQRKIRCNGLQPVCSFCLDHGYACMYHKGPQRVRVSKDFLDSLVKEVQDLKQVNASLASRQTERGDGHHECDKPWEQNAAATPLSCWTASSDSMARDDAVPSSSSFLPLQTTTGLRAGATAVTTETNAEDVTLETTKSVTDTIVGPDSPPSATGGSYFGASSTPAFLKTIQKIASCEGIERGSRIGLRSESRYRAEGIHKIPAANRVNPSTSIKSQFLPPRWTADHLVETYFSEVCKTFTILHEPTFRKEYERLWRPTSSQPPTLWICLANSVFALGALFSDRLRAEESESISETFCSQAMELCHLDTLEEGSLTMVQALLLMGHYLHIKRASRCWHVFGLAIRAAQGLGLHLNDINNKHSVVEREVRKRCWSGCLVMDTMLAMTFGRPTMISPKHYENAKLPEPVDDPCITPPASLEDRNANPPKILVFLQRVKLCIILHNILRTLYESFGQEEIEGAFKAEEMAKFDQDLCGWLAQLPPPLKIKKSGEETADSPSGICVPNQMLYTRYLMVRILLTRPSLVAVWRTAENLPNIPGRLSSLDHTYALSAAKACISSSERMIDQICIDRGLKRGIVGAAWYNTNCVFNAALVIFSAHIIPALRSHISSRHYWQASIDLMRSLSRICHSARACLAMLELLNNHLSQSGERPEQQDIGLNDARTEEAGFVGFPASIPVSDWADSSAFDDLLLGRDYDFLQDMAYAAEL